MKSLSATSKEDGDIARAIADGLEQAGHTVWYYERDSLPGPSYLKQILAVIDQAQAVVVLSSAALDPPQVNIEISEAHVAGKQFVPLLRGKTFATLTSRQRPWAIMFGTAVAAPIPAEGVGTILPRLLRGLQAIGVAPRDADREAAEPAPPFPDSGGQHQKPSATEQATQGTEPVLPIAPSPSLPDLGRHSLADSRGDATSTESAAAAMPARGRDPAASNATTSTPRPRAGGAGFPPTAMPTVGGDVPWHRKPGVLAAAAFVIVVLVFLVGRGAFGGGNQAPGARGGPPSTLGMSDDASPDAPTVTSLIGGASSPSGERRSPTPDDSVLIVASPDVYSTP